MRESLESTRKHNFPDYKVDERNDPVLLHWDLDTLAKIEKLLQGIDSAEHQTHQVEDKVSISPFRIKLQTR